MLPRVSAAPPGEYGQADKRIQAYCYRYCVTDHPDNRIAVPEAEGYDPKQYELLLRIYEAGWRETFDKFDPMPNRKTDSNNHGPVQHRQHRHELRLSRGVLRAAARDPEGARDAIRRAGCISSPTIRACRRTCGSGCSSGDLPKDEFKDNGGWPHQIYVREARRMIGPFVMTENELMKRRPTPDSVGMGSYTIDSHNVQRYITPEGAVQNEGDIGVPLPGPYEIAYGALVPKRGQANNLIVPVCVSSSHIAFGSIRMEPVFMVLAHSAATAASLAIDRPLPSRTSPMPC